MKELSLNILDIAENSAKANAKLIEITLTESPDTLTLDGHAVEKEGGHAKIGKDVWGDGHAKLVADFYRSVERNTPFAIDGEEGAKVLRAILAMYRSHGKETLLTKGEDQ